MRHLIDLGLTAGNLDEFGRYSDLKKDINKEKSKEYLQEKEGTTISLPKVDIKVNNLLRAFIISGGKEFPYFQLEENES